MRDLVSRFCLGDDLSTFDPYDIWTTDLGFWVKDLFNRNRILGVGPAAALALFDAFVNNASRMFYEKREYPIVRALAAQTLLNVYQQEPDTPLLDRAKVHLDWLVAHSCQGFSGLCWGLGFQHAVSKTIKHAENTPFSTMTPYALEAFVRFAEVTGTKDFDDSIRSVLTFFENDILAMEETDTWMATSYSPLRDRVVVNASSYTMFAYALGVRHFGDAAPPAWRERVTKLHRFVANQQRPDGSWLYSPEGKSFIDCFHSCIVLKNLIKTDRIVPLPGGRASADRGYAYLKQNFLDYKTHLYKRFSLSNKPSIVKFDLYDNAEMLLIAALLGDKSECQALSHSIELNFFCKDDIFSQIDFLGFRRNRNMLRWAVLPYLHAYSTYENSTFSSAAIQQIIV